MPLKEKLLSLFFTIHKVAFFPGFKIFEQNKKLYKFVHTIIIIVTRRSLI